MDIAHVEKLVEEAYKAHADAVIASLKAMGREYMTSSDDSRFQNVWEEFASQIQEEESVFWEEYVDKVRRLCDERVQRVSQTELSLLWFFTEPGREWTWSIDYDKEHGIERTPSEDEPPSFDTEDVVDALYQKVSDIASDVELPSEEQHEESDEDEDCLEEEDFEENANALDPEPHVSVDLTLPLFD